MKIKSILCASILLLVSVQVNASVAIAVLIAKKQRNGEHNEINLYVRKQK
jgi:hypothetical protein